MVETVGALWYANMLSAATHNVLSTVQHYVSREMLHCGNVVARSPI